MKSGNGKSTINGRFSRRIMRNWLAQLPHSECPIGRSGGCHVSGGILCDCHVNGNFRTQMEVQYKDSFFLVQNKTPAIDLVNMKWIKYKQWSRHLVRLGFWFLSWTMSLWMVQLKQIGCTWSSWVLNNDTTSKATHSSRGIHVWVLVRAMRLTLPKLPSTYCGI